MKKLFCILVLIALTLSLCVPAFAAEANTNRKTMTAQNAGTFALDGVKDSAYDNALCLPVNVKNDDMSDTSVTLGTMYLIPEMGDETNDYLWCFVEVNNQDEVKAGSGEFYERDSVELFINLKNTDADSDTLQYVVDGLGNVKMYRYNFIDTVIEGGYDKIVHYEKDGVWYMDTYTKLAAKEGDAQQKYNVEYRIPVGKFTDGQKIGYSMTIHDLPSWAWRFVEATCAPQNWVPASYDYITVNLPKQQEPEVTEGADETDKPVTPPEDTPKTGDALTAVLVVLGAAAASVVFVSSKKH